MKQKPNAELLSWRQACWDYLMEHCDTTKDGRYFIKFHTNHKQNFENHVMGRWKYGYHREDPRGKEQQATDQAVQHQLEKALARVSHLENKLRGRRILFWRKLLPFRKK